MRTRVTKRQRKGATVCGATQTLGPYEQVPASISMEGFVALWRRFLRTLIAIVHRLYQNDLILRAFWQPGDVKLSLRQEHDEMPGFVPWRNLTLSRSEFQALWKVVGNGESADDSNEFLLPSSEGRVIQIIGQNEKAGNPDAIDIEDGSPTAQVDVVRLTAWVKT